MDVERYTLIEAWDKKGNRVLCTAAQAEALKLSLKKPGKASKPDKPDVDQLQDMPDGKPPRAKAKK